MTIETWNIQEMTGYEPKTTYYEDLSIAEMFGGANAIKDTYNRVMKTIKSMGTVYLTEFVMALNWKCWRWYGHNDTLGMLYHDLYYKARDYALKNLKGNELSYFLNTTD